MTDNEINIAIAEACGWTLVHLPACDGDDLTEPQDACDVWRNPAGMFVRDCFLPFYTTDLNAMHEAEKHLTDINHRREYAKQLIDWRGELGCVHATSHQRAEAFLRTLGKWKD